jgi:hypothetical protein
VWDGSECARLAAPTPLLSSLLVALYALSPAVDFVRAILFCAAALLSSFCANSTAFAHDTSVAFLDLSVDGRGVEVEAKIHGDDLGAPIGRSPLERPSRQLALERAERATRYVAERLVLAQDERRCELDAIRPASVQEAEAPAFRLVLRFRVLCPRVIDELSVRDNLFFDIDDNHRAFAKVRAFGATHEKVFGVYDRNLRVRGSPSTLAVLRQYVALGVEHILTGYDHLAFLLALLAALAARGTRAGLRPALAVVTSFTLAHSVTLALAALGVVRPSSRYVESTIALSIALVAAIDLRSALRSQPMKPPSTGARAALGFGFGLVHGLGFAGALGELGLPKQALVRSLAAFNVGVELGQLTVATLVFPLLGALGSRLSSRPLGYQRRVLAPISLALVAMGALWFIQRVRT